MYSIPPVRLISNLEGRIDEVPVENDPEAEERFKTLVPSTNFVPYPDSKISDQPLYSHGYTDCNGCVLLGDKLAGLTHYDISYGNPPSDVESLLRNMRFRGQNDLIAVIMAGHTDHFKEIERFLISNDVPIVGRFLDYWDFEGNQKLAKKLLVSPSTKEVIMSASGYGYMFLTKRK